MTMHAFRIIVDVVSALVRMTREQVLGKGRTGMLCIARHVIAWLVRNLFGLSFDLLLDVIGELSEAA
jgi:chromosomal replication initiation ATPase DnaA